MPPRVVPEPPEKFLVAFSFAGEQRDLVRRIAEAVEERLGRGMVFFDEWYEAWIAGSDADKKLQKIYREGCVLAVVCVSAHYSEKFWTLAEHDAIRERVNKSRVPSASNEDRNAVLPIRVADGDVEGISSNTIIPDVRPPQRSLNSTVDLIVNRLRLAAPESQLVAAPPAHPPWPDEPTRFEHGLADRTEQWPDIQTLMTAGAAKRILIFKGQSGYSKTALLDAAARYAKVLSVPVAYVDFKALSNRADVLQVLRLELGALLPNLGKPGEPDHWALRNDLRQLSSPALILLDAYEKITGTTELVDWIEFQLLAEVIECKQLRFLIGGQKVPERAVRWRNLADEKELKKIDDKETWTEWIRQKNPHVDDKHVEAIVLGLEGVPVSISTALTTIAKTLPRTA